MLNFVSEVMNIFQEFHKKIHRLNVKKNVCKSKYNMVSLHLGFIFIISIIDEKKCALCY